MAGEGLKRRNAKQGRPHPPVWGGFLRGGGADRRLLASVVLLVVVTIVAVAVAVYTCPRPLFVSPLDVPFISPVYLPLVSRAHRGSPDSRFGVAEHTPGEAAVLGLGNADYSGAQWRLPLPGDTVVFFTITERDHWSTWKLCSWSPVSGWYDEAGCRQWVRDNPGVIAIIGNELTLDSPIGLGDLVDTEQYAWWYHQAWTLIKNEDPGALVAPYGPVGGAGGLLIDVWDSYWEQFGALLQADFYPVHHYCEVEDEAWWCWRKLSNWVDWLGKQRGVHWSGPRDFWLTEWGLPAWEEPAPRAMTIMEGMTPLLKANDIGITRHAWWPSCNSGWRDSCTLLISGGQVTELGERYLELALE